MPELQKMSKIKKYQLCAGSNKSPLLANLSLHCVLDKWLDKEHQEVTLVRCADDIVVHCISETQRHYVLLRDQRQTRYC